MPFESHTWVTPRTVPWFVTGDTTAPHTVALHLHGLHERARPVAEALPALPGVAFVVPEALSRALGRPGAPAAGACWSTGEDAAIDLADNVRYLDALDARCRERWPYARRVLIGFSQGGLTAARWLAASAPAFDRVVLWASVVPADVDAAALRAALEGRELVVAVGDRDPFVTPSARAALLQRLRDLALPWRLHRFPGGHELEPDALAAALR